jgi:hypothetical protein
VPARALRDTLRNLGRRYPREVDLADNAAATDVVLSSAPDVAIEKVALDAQVGALCTAPTVSLGVEVLTPNLRLGATTGSITVDFVDGGSGADTIVRSTGSFIADGFRVGATITATGVAEAGNAGPFVLTGVEALTLTVAPGSLTASAGDTGVTITSLNIITGFAPSAGFVSGALLNVLDGGEAGQYTVDSAGADFVVIDNGTPFSAVVADYDDGLTLSTVIVRTSGSFVSDGFWVGGKLTVSGALDVDNDDVYEIVEVTPLAIVTVEEFVGDFGPDSAARVAIENQIHALDSDWDAEGFSGGEPVFLGSVLIGEVDSLANSNADLVLVAPLDPAVLGLTGSVGTRSTIKRNDAGDFTADGFANGDRIQIASGPNAGTYTVFDADELVLTLSGNVVAEDEAESEALIYKVALGSRD